MTRKKRNDKAARKARNKRKRDEQSMELDEQTAQLHELVVDCWNSYATDWLHHSESFRVGEHYKWMAGFLEGRGRVLEIGTGDGSGTIALFQNGSTILSIDHNPKCHDLAEARLQEASIPTTRERRGTIHFKQFDFGMRYTTPQSSLLDGEVLLLEGDVSSRDEAGLEQWLSSLPQFDAIACWNIGTYAIITESIGTPQVYRLHVQNALYTLADRILRPGGVLHIVDRGPAPAAEVLDEQTAAWLEYHQDQASPTSLTLDTPSIKRRNFTLGTGASGIVMKQKNEAGGFTNSPSELTFWSILATKP